MFTFIQKFDSLPELLWVLRIQGLEVSSLGQFQLGKCTISSKFVLIEVPRFLGLFIHTGRQVSVSKRVHDCALKVSKTVYNFCPPEVCVLAHCLPTHLANHSPVSKACTKLHNNVTVHAVYSHLLI